MDCHVPISEFCLSERSISVNPRLHRRDRPGLQHDGRPLDGEAYRQARGRAVLILLRPLPEEVRGGAGQLPEEQAAPEPMPAGTIYTCPIHPEIKQVGPGDCPICGMALEPKGVLSGDEGPNPELVDFRRRFAVGAAPTAPLLVIAMGPMLWSSRRRMARRAHRCNALRLRAVRTRRLTGAAGAEQAGSGIAQARHHAGGHVVEVVAVQRPIAGIVGVEGDRHAVHRRDEHGVTHGACNPPPPQSHDLEVMAVQMHRVRHHGAVEEGQLDPRARGDLERCALGTPAAAKPRAPTRRETHNTHRLPAAGRPSLAALPFACRCDRPDQLDRPSTRRIVSTHGIR